MKKNLIIFILILILIIGGVLGYKYWVKKSFESEPGSNGNTAGNLYNSGLFCQQGDLVYFSNPSDKGSLYVMNADGSNAKKISDDSAYYINCDENYIYYCRNKDSAESMMSFLNVNQNSLCRVDKKGKDVVILDDAPCTYASLSSDKLFYYHYDETDATTLYSINKSKSGKKQVVNGKLDPRGLSGSNLYYSGYEKDHYLYAYNVDNGSTSLIYDSTNIWQPVVIDNTMYAMDLNNNYRLISVNLSTKNKNTLTEAKVSTFNVIDNYVFYETMTSNNTNALYQLNLTTGKSQKIADGNYIDLNVTSKYLYFVDYDTNQMYKSTYGNSNKVEIFEVNP